MGCPVVDVINRANFQLDRFMGFRAPDGRISLSPIDLRHQPYNSYVLPCYTVIVCRTNVFIAALTLSHNFSLSPTCWRSSLASGLLATFSNTILPWPKKTDVWSLPVITWRGVMIFATSWRAYQNSWYTPSCVWSADSLKVDVRHAACTHTSVSSMSRITTSLLLSAINLA